MTWPLTVIGMDGGPLSTLAVAGRPGSGPGALRPDLQAVVD